MNNNLSIHTDAWTNGSPIPAPFAFGKPGTDGPFALSDNISPAISWSSAPEGTQSFAFICHDPDVPSVGDDVNQAGRVVPADLPRVDFYHWVLVDIPPTVSNLAEGFGSQRITPRGKDCTSTDSGINGQNSYTDWFAGDPDMEGIYGAYDGPCPPWNDSIPHRYYFTIYALGVPSLNLNGAFTGGQVLDAIKGHVLASAEHMGTYSMNPKVPA